MFFFFSSTEANWHKPSIVKQCRSFTLEIKRNGRCTADGDDGNAKFVQIFEIRRRIGHAKIDELSSEALCGDEREALERRFENRDGDMLNVPLFIQFGHVKSQESNA